MSDMVSFALFNFNLWGDYIYLRHYALFGVYLELISGEQEDKGIDEFLVVMGREF